MAVLDDETRNVIKFLDIWTVIVRQTYVKDISWKAVDTWSIKSSYSHNIDNTGDMCLN